MEAPELVKEPTTPQGDSSVILRMIEAMKPDDTAALDEIDARVWCYLNGYLYLRKQLDYHVYSFGDDLECFLYQSRDREYTRSRDALKAVRPEGWRLEIQHVRSLSKAGTTKWYSSLISPCGDYEVNCGPMLTEELAELHAIIQAIAYERSKA